MYTLRYKIPDFAEGFSPLSKSDSEEGSVFRRNGGTDTGNARCHSVHCLRYFAYGKERDQGFLKCSVNTGELQVSVIIGADTLVFHRQLHQCRLFAICHFEFFSGL
jgi:hypothetical protein